MATATRPKRGRPKQSDDDIQYIRQRILAATRCAFGQYGSQGLTVEKIIQAAGISRPTFYKYFDKAEVALDLVIKDTNDILITRIEAAASRETQPVPLMQAVIDTYLAWGEEEIEILGFIQQELLSPESPVAKHRLRVLDSMYELLKITLANEGRPAPERVTFDSLLLAAEKIGYHLLLNSSPTQANAYKVQILKLAIALLGNQQEWQEAGENAILFQA